METMPDGSSFTERFVKRTAKPKACASSVSVTEVTWSITDVPEPISGGAHVGRLVGLAHVPDGSLLIGGDTNGVIYRVSFRP